MTKVYVALHHDSWNYTPVTTILGVYASREGAGERCRYWWRANKESEPTEDAATFEYESQGMDAVSVEEYELNVDGSQPDE